MVSALAWFVALMAMAQEIPAGAHVTAEEAAATLKQSAASNTVDTLMKGVDVLGGKAGPISYLVYRFWASTPAK